MDFRVNWNLIKHAQFDIDPEVLDIDNGFKKFVNNCAVKLWFILLVFNKILLIASRIYILTFTSRYIKLKKNNK